MVTSQTIDFSYQSQYTTNEYKGTTSRLQVTSKDNLCLVCGDEEGDCRVSENQEVCLCHGYQGADIGEIINGFRCTGSAQNPRWSVFTVLRERIQLNLSDTDRRQTQYLLHKWKEINQEAKPAKSKSPLAEAQSLTPSESEKPEYMPVECRHEHYSKIAQELNQDAELITFLKKRGFTDEQIERSQFKSARQYQRLLKKYPAHLPGIGSKGNQLVLVKDGFLLPVFTYDEEIAVFHARLYDTSKGKYRVINGNSSYPGATPQEYKILTSENTLEPPLCVRKVPSPTHIGLTEGVGVKPFLAADLTKGIIFGASGGNFSASQNLLREYIKRALEDYPELASNPICLYPDAGDIDNQEVMLRWTNTKLLLESWGYNVGFVWWGQTTKDDCDIDELTSEQISQTQLLTPNEFFELHSDKLIFVADRFLPPDRLKRWVANNEFTPTEGFSFDSPKFTIPAFEYQGYDLLFKAAMGLGKTEALLDLIKILQDKGIKCVVVVPLNTLCHNTIGRALKKGINLQKVGQNNLSQNTTEEEDSEQVEVLFGGEGSIKHQIMCTESLAKIENELQGAEFIMDEALICVKQVLSGGTVTGKKQAYILELIKKAIKVCRRRIYLDANMNDRFAQLIAELSEDPKKIIKIEYTHQIPKSPIIFRKYFSVDSEGKIPKKELNTKNSHVYEVLNSDLKHFIFSDNRKLVKQLARNASNNKKKVIAIHREANGQSYEEWFKENEPIAKTPFAKKLAENPLELKKNWVEDFMDDPDKFIENFQPDLVLGSPTIATGVSIQLKYFDRKDMFCTGVAVMKTLTQGTVRYRNPDIPLYISCVKSSTIARKNNYGAMNEYSLQAKMAEALLNHKEELAKKGEATSLPEIMSVIEAAYNRQIPAFFNYQAHLDIEEQFEKEHHSACLIYSLKRMGYQISFENVEVNLYEADKISGIGNNLKLTQSIFYNKENTAVCEAEPYESIEEAKEVAKNNPNANQRARISKTFLLNRLPGFSINSDWDKWFVREYWVKNQQAITQEELLHLIKNPEYSHKLHEKNAYHLCTSQYTFSPSLLKENFLKAKALRDLGILELIEKLEKREFIHKNSPEVVDMLTRIRTDKKLRDYLNMKVPAERLDGSDRMRFIRTLLNTVGVFLSKGRQIVIDGIQTRCYRLRIDEVEFDYDHDEKTAERKFDEFFADLQARKTIQKCLDRRMEAWLEAYEAPQWEVEADRDLQFELAKGSTGYAELVRMQIHSKRNEKVYEPVKSPLEVNVAHLDELAENPQENAEAIKTLWKSESKVVKTAWLERITIQTQKVLESLNLYNPSTFDEEVEDVYIWEEDEEDEDYENWVEEDYEDEETF